MTNTDKNNKYQNGKIYSIRSYQTDKYYIGSTCSPLHKRLYQHRVNFKRWKDGKGSNVSAYEIVKFDDCYIELIEFYSCKSVYELEKREGKLIRLNKDSVVNQKLLTFSPYAKSCDHVICRCGSKVQMCNYLKHCIKCGSTPKDFNELTKVYDEKNQTLKKQFGTCGNATFV